jgi:hypothetical protein
MTEESREPPEAKPAPVPLGHFDHNALIQIFPHECALLGALTMLWGQFEVELCELMRRLSNTDKQTAEIIFFGTRNHKARRDLIAALVEEKVPDRDCQNWMHKALKEVKRAADKRNNLIHSEYFVEITKDRTFTKQRTPGRKNRQIVREKIIRQIEEAISAISEARFFMEFAFAATRGETALHQSLETYEPVLRERRGLPPRPGHPSDTV